MPLTHQRLEEIRRLANSKLFGPETADEMLAELIAEVDRLRAVPRGTSEPRYPVLSAAEAKQSNQP